MKPSSALLMLSLLSSAVVAVPADVRFRSFEYAGHDAVFETPLPAGSYRNPILAGFHPDPSICRAGDDFYLINSTFAYFPGIPVFHSRDLVNWTQVGHVISRPEQLKYDRLGVSRAIFAPAISYHDGIFYVVCTMVGSGGNFVVTARDPAGPWSDPAWFSFEGIDPSLFFAEDGRAWLVNNGAPEGKPLYEGHRAIWQQEFDPKTRTLIGPRKVLVNGGVDLTRKPIWIEGPHLYRRGGWYYLSCAEGGTGDQHSQVVFRSRSVTGPFEPWSGNPILTQRDLDPSAAGAVTSTGHADLVVGPDGSWWAVFLGCRPYESRFYNTGRETFMLPVTWTADDWPVILPRGERVPLVVKSPAGKSAGTGPIPLTGNFTWRDDFRGPELAPVWITLRTSRDAWWHLDGNNGLRLTPRAERLSGKGQPAFLAHRVRHSRWDAAIEFEAPSEAGVSAGLAVFQNENHHYFAGVRRTADGIVAFVEQASGADPKPLVTQPVTGSGRVTVRARAVDGKISFEVASDAGVAARVTEADGKLLSTQVAGGFVGTTVGLHVRREP